MINFLHHPIATGLMYPQQKCRDRQPFFFFFFNLKVRSFLVAVGNRRHSGYNAWGCFTATRSTFFTVSSMKPHPHRSQLIRSVYCSKKYLFYLLLSVRCPNEDHRNRSHNLFKNSVLTTISSYHLIKKKHPHFH